MKILKEFTIYTYKNGFWFWEWLGVINFTLFSLTAFLDIAVLDAVFDYNKNNAVIINLESLWKEVILWIK